MKKQMMYLLMMPLSFLIWSCSTKSDPTPTAAAKFTVNGTVYNETSAADSAASLTGSATRDLNALGVSGLSADKSAQAAMIFFWPGTAKPKAGSYTVVGDATKLASGQVAVLVIDKVNVAKQGLYGTTGLDGTTVNVAISSSGKLTVTIPTVAIKGTNFDNTDPKNTVTSDVTGSISGSAVEQ